MTLGLTVIFHCDFPLWGLRSDTTGTLTTAQGNNLGYSGQANLNMRAAADPYQTVT